MYTSAKILMRDARLDYLTCKYTAFTSFAELLDAEGGYRPSFYVRGRRPVEANEVRELADNYDVSQEVRDDPRRAFRGDFGATAAYLIRSRETGQFFRSRLGSVCHWTEHELLASRYANMAEATHAWVHSLGMPASAVEFVRV